MPRFTVLSLLLCTAMFAAETSDVYRGRMVRTEEISRQSNPFLRGQFLGYLDGKLAFQIVMFDRAEIFRRAIYEKLIVTRDPSNPDDPGFRSVVPGQFIQGEPERTEEVNELAPAANRAFRYHAGEGPETTARTNDTGVLLDADEAVLLQLEDLRQASVQIVFSNQSDGACHVELTRAEFNNKMGISYEYQKKSYPKNLKAAAEWDKQIYKPGEIATLTLKLSNRGENGDVVRLLGRSLSRWNWLDGKMFYLGDLAPQERATFSRRFIIPDDAPAGIHYLRIGFNDISGTKPQLPLTLQIAYTGNKQSH